MTEPASDRRDFLATVGIVACVFGAVAVPFFVRRLGPHPSTAECDALLDRYVAFVARAENPKVTPGEIEQARVDARARAASRGEIARCAEDSSAEGVACAMSAGGADEVERCLQ